MFKAIIAVCFILFLVFIGLAMNSAKNAAEHQGQVLGAMIEEIE